MEFDKLYFYNINQGQLCEVRVARETDKSYILETNPADVRAVGIRKSNGRNQSMISGDTFFFTDRETAVERLRDFCLYKVAELQHWQERLKELE